MLDHLGLWWLGAAAILALAELIVPGVFLIFVAAAAAITGIVTLAVPGLPIAGQLVMLGFWSAITVAFLRRWYLESPGGSSDPLLNDRGARLVGELVIVTEAIEHGHGRVRLGDGEWLATGPDLPIGTAARVVAVEATAVRVEPITPPPLAG